jgi:hypothetical protein
VDQHRLDGVASDQLLDHQILEGFADALEEYAPEVLAEMAPGLSEDEIRSRCATAGLDPSRDAVSWWTFWDGPGAASPSPEARAQPEEPMVRPEILPGFQAGPLDSCTRGITWWRQFAEQEAPSLQATGTELDDLWRRSWIPMFTDGGGGHTILDCEEPEHASVLRDCFRENFASPDWGKPIRSIGPWLAHATDWLRLGTCRYDPQSGIWQPHDASRAYWPVFDPDASYDEWR